jgi:hypothetical protein
MIAVDRYHYLTDIKHCPNNAGSQNINDIETGEVFLLY